MPHVSLSRRRFTPDSLVSLLAGASIEAIGCAQQQVTPCAVTRRQTGSIAGPFDFLCSPEAQWVRTRSAKSSTGCCHSAMLTGTEANEENDMGTTDIERNKQVAIAFWNRIFVGRDPAGAVAEHVGETYTQHNPDTANGPDASSRQ